MNIRITRNYILNFTVSGLLGLAMMVSINYLSIIVTPASYYFKYTSVESAKPEFTPTDDLRFFSTANYKKPVHMEWNDVLYCTSEESQQYGTFSTYSSESLKVTVKDVTKNKSAGWVYQSHHPSYESTCYLRSTIEAKLKYGIIKTQVVESNKFYIKDVQ